MFDTYEDIFNQRGELYNRAGNAYPEARSQERLLILERLQLTDGCRVCDIPSGGGYVADGLVSRGLPAEALVCVEPSKLFAQGLDPRYPRLVGHMDRIPLADQSVDRIISLAGIHHLEDKRPFFREARRILGRGGIIAVADVMVGTPAAGFLNEAVDRYTETGHEGIFLEQGELTRLMRETGFTPLDETHRRFTWDFPDMDAMVFYCRSLFGMVKAGDQQVLDSIYQHLEVTDGEDGVHMAWSLVYATGQV